MGFDGVSALFDNLRSHLCEAIRYLRKEMVLAGRVRRFRTDVCIVRRRWKIRGAGAGWYEPAHPVPSDARRLRRSDDGINFRDYRRHFFAGGTRQIPGRVFGSLGFCVRIWADVGRMAHGSDLMASYVLRQFTGGFHRHCRVVPLLSILASERRKAAYRLGRCGDAGPLCCSIAAGPDVGHRLRLVFDAGRTVLVFAFAMLGAFLYSETKAIEPMIPLSLFSNPIITQCSTGVFVVGIAMFGMIIYLPLFMQGVLGVTATKSGNLLTPMMLGIVIGTFVCGQITLRFRSYKTPMIVG